LSVALGSTRLACLRAVSNRISLGGKPLATLRHFAQSSWVASPGKAFAPSLVNSPLSHLIRPAALCAHHRLLRLPDCLSPSNSFQSRQFATVASLFHAIAFHIGWFIQTHR
jgi:hypothetical protein